VRRAAAAVLLTACLLLAGCGSGSLSSPQLRTRAGALCRHAKQRTARIPTPAQPSGGAAFLQAGLGALEPELRGLRALRPPRQAASEFAAAVSALRTEVAAIRQTLTGLRGGQDPVIAIKTLQRTLAPQEAAADAAWHRLDIPGCLQTGS
jgi:hypothetical protein